MTILRSPSASSKSKRPSRYTPTRQRDRKVRLAAWLADLQAGALRITEDGKEDVYFLKRLDADFGAAFRVEKWRPAQGDLPAGCEEPYDCCVNGEESSCECKGFLRRGHCRHLEALGALVKAGQFTCTKASA